MALAILDGNQSATTLSTIVVSSAHIPAHTVVSLGSQAITDIVNATSAGLTDTQLRASAVTISGTVTIGAGTAQIGSVTASISGTVPISISSVTIGNFPASQAVTFSAISVSNFPATQPVSLTTLPALVGSTAQIGSVTASISGTVPVSGTFFQATQPVSLASLPSLVAGTAQIGSVTASISGTIPISISSVTIGNSITISNFPATQAISISSVTVGNSLTISSLPAISGTVTANVQTQQSDDTDQSIKFFPIGYAFRQQGGLLDYYEAASSSTPLPVYLPSSLPAGTNSIGVVTVGNTVTIAGTVTANPTGTQTIAGSVTASISGTVPISISSVTIGNSITIGSLPAISGTVTANVFGKDYDGTSVALPIITHESGVATRGIPIGYNDNGSGTFFIVSSNAPLPVAPALYDGDATPIQLGQDGDVASPSLVVPIGFAGDGGFKRVAFDAGLPISGTVTIGSGTVTANPSISSTAITSGSFTSLTSETLVPADTARKMATVYNLGAGQLFINAGETATTLGGGFMVALSSGDFYECPYTTTTLSAIFATAGTASWVSH